MEFVHEGETIKLGLDGMFSRVFPGEGYGGDPKLVHYDSLAKARAAIDSEMAAARKAKDATINVTLLDETGKTMVLRRVHEGSGGWLTRKGDAKEPRHGYLPMDVPKGLLEQKAVLIAQIGAIDNALRPYSVRLPHGYGRQNPDSIDSLISRLNNAVAEAEEGVAALAEDRPVNINNL